MLSDTGVFACEQIDLQPAVWNRVTTQRDALARQVEEQWRLLEADAALCKDPGECRVRSRIGFLQWTLELERDWKAQQMQAMQRRDDAGGEADVLKLLIHQQQQMAVLSTQTSRFAAIQERAVIEEHCLDRASAYTVGGPSNLLLCY